MYKLCKSEQSSQRQRQIEDALLELLLIRRYEEITVSDLCERIGLPRKSFYRYFSGKDGALYALIDHVIMDHLTYAEQYKNDGKENPQSYLEAICRYWKGCKKLLDALENSALSGVLIQRAMTFTNDRDALPNFLQIGDQRLREYGQMFLVCGLMTMILQWHHDRFYKSSEEMAQLAMQLFTQPLFGGKL